MSCVNAMALFHNSFLAPAEFPLGDTYAPNVLMNELLDIGFSCVVAFDKA
jgi:hypothetical protein